MSELINRLNTDTVLVTQSLALARLPGLTALLANAPITLCRYRWQQPAANGHAVLVWGQKPSARKGEQLAAEHQLPLLRLEDGFLRSVGLGADCPPYSIVLDDVGIYYDARSPSRLESLIAQPLTAAQQQRAEQFAGSWRQARVSKYNHSKEHAVPAEPYVLVVDQTFGDASIEYGLASSTSFQQMLQSALERYPQHQVILKIHPDVFAGKKQGHFSAEQLQHPRIQVLTEDIHAPALLEKASAVFCVTSQMGFEALLWQKPVYTFGMPFYAGWGLTNDALTAPARRQPVSFTQLVYAAMLAYPRYLDPETGQRCEAEQLLSWLGLQRQQRNRFVQPLWLQRPPYWKTQAFKRFFQGSDVKIVPRKQAIPEGCWQLVWGAKAGDKLIRVEDGFIRSVGLGADLTQPASWVVDETGMYYDARTPSKLEQLLATHSFTVSERQRAAQLIGRLLALKVTKYNVGSRSWRRPDADRVILVPGQVESDASIRYGSPVIKSNLALLQQVRAANPAAYIVYKPHPDVQAGLRLAGEADGGAAAQYCNEVLGNEDMAHLLSQVDEVHTLTSLTGFEALLRGVAVTCYGQPFYAGWGLTTDIYPNERRQRKLALSELVAATLLLYPTYISTSTGCFTTPERVITELEQQRSQHRRPGIKRQLMRLLQRYWRF